MPEMFSLPDQFSFLDAAELQNPQEHIGFQANTGVSSSAPEITVQGSDHLQISFLGFDSQTLSQTDDHRPEHGDQALPPRSINRDTVSSHSDDSTLQNYLHEFEAGPSTVPLKRKRNNFLPNGEDKLTSYEKLEHACVVGLPNQLVS
ncbi:hypothetical protein DL98DRAFT_512361 [Cadophora sp. DSE1049]|nr:hypothetical protein DL98DRAFT_512361 [Cadophora sp. DSE1049]